MVLKYLSSLFAIIMMALVIGCVTMDTTMRLYVGMSKTELRKMLLFTTSPSDDPFLTRAMSGWFFDGKREVVFAPSKKIFYVFDQVTRPGSSGDYGNGRLIWWESSESELRRKLAHLASKDPRKLSIPVSNSITNTESAAEGEIAEQESLPSSSSNVRKPMAPIK